LTTVNGIIVDINLNMPERVSVRTNALRHMENQRGRRSAGLESICAAS
jgi:hypothetical protein